MSKQLQRVRAKGSAPVTRLAEPNGLGEGTPILLADGRVLPVEQIVIGSRLMGPDGKARRVLSTTNGRGPLYRIEPIKGEPWVCNAVHVLTLVHSTSNKIIDIPLDEWHCRHDKFRHQCKQFSVGIDAFKSTFGDSTRPVDPYFLGLWFGDGGKELAERRGVLALTRVLITNVDPEVIAAVHEQAAKWELNVRTYDNGDVLGCAHVLTAEDGQAKHRNRLTQALRDLVGSKVEMPAAYLCGPRDVRLQFLAGLLDTDGWLIGPTFHITQKREDWARAIVWLARSLGFSATLRQRTNHTPKKDGSLGLYWYVIIGGNTHLIPTRILRKRAQDYKRQKVATRTGFAPRPIGQGAYYGFALDGDGRFLLGDFTVTHSTVRSLGTSVPVSRALHSVDRSALGARIPRFSRRTLTAATTRHAARNERLA